MVYPDAMRTRISAMTAVELSGEDLNAVKFLVNFPVKTVELPREDLRCIRLENLQTESKRFK